MRVFITGPARKITIVFPILLLSTLTVMAQAHAPSASDLLLIRGRSFADPSLFDHYHGAGNNDRPIQNKQHNVIVEYNPLTLVLKGAMLGYQKLLSEQLARSCPYEITCSNFSKQSIQEFGAFKGVFLSADRILRC